MNRNYIWKLLFIAFVVLWSLREMYPPRSRNLIDEFQNKASKTDTNFNAIVERARQLQKEFPERAYGNLTLAIGTNSIAQYFPSVNVSAEKNPNRAVLNRLQKEGAGKIKLGLDLQGGTSFLVQMDTKIGRASCRERV